MSGELIFNGGLMAVFAYCYYYIGLVKFKPDGVNLGPIAWPRFILGMLIVLTAINTFQVWKKGPGKAGVDKATELRFWLAGGVLAGYIIGLQYLGFIISSLVFIVVYMWLTGEKRLWLYAVTSPALTFGLYYVFGKGLQVMLPRGAGIFRVISLFFER